MARGHGRPRGVGVAVTVLPKQFTLDQLRALLRHDPPKPPRPTAPIPRLPGKPG
jgi:hypothetical protein